MPPQGKNEGLVGGEGLEGGGKAVDAAVGRGVATLEGLRVTDTPGHLITDHKPAGTVTEAVRLARDRDGEARSMLGIPVVELDLS